MRHLPVLKSGPPTGAISDGLRRVITYVRISLTDRCNYRCTYCMPEAGVELMPRSDLLSFEEITKVVQALMHVGVRRVRLTGGEPTVRKDLIELVEHLSQLGLDDLALSTNGERLLELCEPLYRAGLHRLNVSLDTLDAEKFYRITRRGKLGRVLSGLEAVRAVGFVSTKLNTVAMRGFNDDELGALCRYAWDRGFVPRFIELMPMAEGQLFYPGTFLSAAEIRAILEREFGPRLALGLAESEAAQKAAGALPKGVGPARYDLFRYAGGVHRVGLISAVTEPFCDTCNRVRLSATGQLHACLAYDDAIDLRTILRQNPGPGPSQSHDQDPQDDRDLFARLIEAAQSGLLKKRPGHTFDDAGCGGPKKYMVSIGG